MLISGVWASRSLSCSVLHRSTFKASEARVSQLTKNSKFQYISYCRTNYNHCNTAYMYVFLFSTETPTCNIINMFLFLLFSLSILRKSSQCSHNHTCCYKESIQNNWRTDKSILGFLIDQRCIIYARQDVKTALCG